MTKVYASKCIQTVEDAILPPVIAQYTDLPPSEAATRTTGWSHFHNADWNDRVVVLSHNHRLPKYEPAFSEQRVKLDPRGNNTEWFRVPGAAGVVGCDCEIPPSIKAVFQLRCFCDGLVPYLVTLVP